MDDIKKAILAIRGARDEAETIAVYLERLTEEGAGEETETYKEIISDELNHIVRFTELCSELSGIEIAED